jgi:NitT/TauT family transport system substrate-binding protein
MFKGLRYLAVCLLGGWLLTPAAAQIDKLKVALGAPNNCGSGIVAVGQRDGIFRKHSLDPVLLFTRGGETLQTVISGSVDIGISAGTSALFGALARGAPVGILLAGTTGAGDLHWYVPANSPIKSFADADGKTVAYSTTGASTHLTALALIKHSNVKASAFRRNAVDIPHMSFLTR